VENCSFSPDPNAGKQEANFDWWESNPMTYDWEGERQAEEEGTKEWFKQVDEEFWRISKSYAHPDYPHCAPFCNLIDYSKVKGKNVLEIGCGTGAHAAVFANAGAEVTAIDLTERAVNLTKKRFELFDIKNASVMKEDAENLPFPDNSFDYVWSWGCIHHSANTEKIVSEIWRVLKANGHASVMIYNRNSTRYFIYGLYQGIFKGKFLRHRSLYAVNMTYTDGHIAKHYTHKGADRLFEHFRSVSTRVMDSSVPDIPGWSKLTRWFPALMRPINKSINERWGWFLFVEAVK